MKVKDHFLYDSTGKQVPFKQSPNIGSGVLKQEYIIIHYDASASAEGAISWMLSPKSKVSAHLSLSREGKFFQLVKFNQVAYHAGKSSYKDRVGLNSYSIGIELQNTGTQQYTPIQMEQLVAVCKALKEAYPIKDITGHSTIAPLRKQDPEGASGKLFDWNWFNTQMKGEEDMGTNCLPTKVTTTELNLREGASTTRKIVTVLPKSTEITVLDTEGDWSHVITKSKIIGWVSSKYLI